MMKRKRQEAGMRGSAALLLMISGAVLAEPPRFEAPARLGPARSEEVQPASFTVKESTARYVPDDVAEASVKPVQAPRYDHHPVEDFLARRVQPKANPDTRDSGKFGDGFADLFDPQKPKEWLFSDHGFDCFASPISNPFLAEDPRSLTELRPIFLYQAVPGQQPNFQGGNIWFFGLRGSLALTDRLSIVMNKFGGINVDASNPAYGSNFGFAEFWLGPKYSFYRDTNTGTIAAGGLMFQIPTGSDSTLQDTGSLSLVPYVSVGKTLGEWQGGAFNGIAVTGISLSTTDDRSNYFYMHAHLDYDVGNHHRFYPVAELNWFQYTRGGERYFSGQGHDLINTGAQESNNASLFTGALGFRYKITESSQFGFAFELPLLGNRDLFDYRFTIDFIFRY